MSQISRPSKLYQIIGQFAYLIQSCGLLFVMLAGQTQENFVLPMGVIIGDGFG